MVGTAFPKPSSSGNLENHGSELIAILSKELATGTISRTTIDRLILFKMTSSAMIAAAAAFVEAAREEEARVRRLPSAFKETTANGFGELLHEYHALETSGGSN